MKVHVARVADLLDPEKLSLFMDEVNKFEEDAVAVDVMTSPNVMVDDGVFVVAQVCAVLDLTTRSMKAITLSQWDKKMKRLAAERA